MSATHEHDDGPHEGPIKTPKQLIVTVVLSFVVPIFAIVLLVMYVAAEHRPSAGSDGLGAEAVARRIQPIGPARTAIGGRVSLIGQAPGYGSRTSSSAATPRC